MQDLFKTICFYHITPPAPGPRAIADTINKFDCPSLESMPGSLESVGFDPIPFASYTGNTPPRSVLVKNKYLFAMLRHEQRKIDRKALKRKLDDAKRDYLKQNGVKMPGKKIKELKETLLEKLAKDAPIDVNFYHVLINTQDGYIAWDCTKYDLHKMLTVRIPELNLHRGFSAEDPDNISQTLTHMIRTEKPDPFELGYACTLKGSDKETVRIQNADISAQDEVQEFIADGFEVRELALQFFDTQRNHFSFAMNDQQIIKRWSATTEAGDPLINTADADMFGSYLLLCVESMNKLRGKLHQAFPNQLWADMTSDTFSDMMDNEQATSNDSNEHNSAEPEPEPFATYDNAKAFTLTQSRVSYDSLKDNLNVKDAGADALLWIVKLEEDGIIDPDQRDDDDNYLVLNPNAPATTSSDSQRPRTKILNQREAL